MKTYAASYWQTLLQLRLPVAMPFIFNALKINSTLALIGAIVAEFFGTPIVGMGFRISTEVGRLQFDMVWAEIAVAAVAGSASLWVVALASSVATTFWHPPLPWCARRSSSLSRQAILPSAREAWLQQGREKKSMKTNTHWQSLAGGVGRSPTAQAMAADKVTLQLKWVTQAQFAGYYVAKDKGFYEAGGLDVTIKPGGPDSPRSR